MDPAIFQHKKLSLFVLHNPYPGSAAKQDWRAVNKFDDVICAPHNCGRRVIGVHGFECLEDGDSGRLVRVGVDFH